MGDLNKNTLKAILKKLFGGLTAKEKRSINKHMELTKCYDSLRSKTDELAFIMNDVINEIIFEPNSKNGAWVISAFYCEIEKIAIKGKASVRYPFGFDEYNSFVKYLKLNVSGA